MTVDWQVAPAFFFLLFSNAILEKYSTLQLAINKKLNSHLTCGTNI
jgi:hypothetical protein